MSRPIKWRKVENIPQYKYFKPANISKRDLDENILKVEEIEAIRLKDLEGLDQEKCATHMEISRQTFQRIYNSAKFKIADSLINGKSISIKGGNYTQHVCKLVCEDCGHVWECRVEDKYDGERCPVCDSEKVSCENHHKDRHCLRRCKGRNINRKTKRKNP